MNCDAFKNSFYAYLEGLLSDAARADFEAHRDGCEACTDLFALGTELTCRNFVEGLDDYVEDRLEPEVKEVFDRHLSVCPDCTAFLDSYRRTMTLTRAAFEAPDGAVPQGLPEDLVRAVLEARRRQ